jgi:hypothetical protein
LFPVESFFRRVVLTLVLFPTIWFLLHWYALFFACFSGDCL